MMFFAPQRRPRATLPDDGLVDPEPASTALWRRLLDGDLGALDGLYRREAGPVYRYALALGGNAAWAADATQEAFVALATRPSGYDPARGPLGAYLAGVARHALAARWRELKREEPFEDEGAASSGGRGTDVDGRALDGPQATEPGANARQAWPAALGAPSAARAAWPAAQDEAASPEALLVRTQELQALWAALRALPAVFREAVVLVDLQQRPYAEAALVAGVELNTLRTRVHRGRARLAILLKGAPEEGPQQGAPRVTFPATTPTPIEPRHARPPAPGSKS